MFIDKKSVGSILKQARIKARYSQGQLAEKVCLSEKHISNIERGVNYPALDSFFRISKVLNLSLIDFGIDVKVSKNNIKDELINKILVSDDVSLINYLKAIKFVDDLF